MASNRFDVVLFGATGFTGSILLEYLLTSEYSRVTHAVAERNEEKLRSTLRSVGDRLGEDLSSTKVIIADSGDPESLAVMARQAKVLVNAVGPYRLHGEAVVKAAIENGAHYIDVAGEPAFLEKMEMKYNTLAKEKGLFVVGACGFDSMPCDLGVHFLKRSFKGDLCYVETVFQNHYGEAGYTASATTYDTLIHSLSEEKIDELRRVRSKIMPEKMPLSNFKPPKRPVVSYFPEVKGYVTPFHGADKSVVSRSQYFDLTENQERPLRVKTYFRGQSFFWASAHPLWLEAFRSAVQHKWARDVLRRHPEFFSFGMFSREGATREQLNQ
uniref:Sacchrp_dh_NADP domain-containing protein n=1 Tax=Steinernema glaseri TaxID=37863 RepID=A0A1I7YMZ6_9BILA